MRVSEHFGLTKSQGALEFVDVDTSTDLPVFLSPTALELIPSPWGKECVKLIQSYFGELVKQIKAGNHLRALALLEAIKEPNETHLGLSKAASRGRALGPGSAKTVWTELSSSNAAKSGLLKDLEDTVLLVHGVGDDIISDITTNIIRQPLIRFTQSVCERYSIPMQQGVASGPMWDPGKLQWFEEMLSLPIASGRRLILVPKAIVRMRMEYDVAEYYRHYLLTHLQGVELAAGSSLVELLKNGNARVTKKALIEKYGSGKDAVIQQTLANPGVLASYRAAKKAAPKAAMEHEELAEPTKSDPPDWDKLLAAVLSVPPGKKGASAYEKAIEELLSALFYPNLSFPEAQSAIHDGRKRIDIKYINLAKHGFFRWVSMHYKTPNIYVECKNYSGDPANPELDQLSGRFSVNRGNVGILVCRSFSNKDLFIRRCRDTADDGRGFIIALDDDDLNTMIEARKKQTLDQIEDRFLQTRFDKLIL